MGLTFADDRGINVKDTIITLCHALDSDRDSAGNLVGHHAQCLLADQLCCDLAHRLICDRVLIIVLRTFRKVLEDRVDQGIGVRLLHR